MSESSIQTTKTIWKFLFFVIIAALLSPHTLEISSQNIIDASFTRYSVITVVLTLFYELGSTIAGPYSTIFIMPPTSAMLLNVLTLLLNVSIILSLVGFARRAISMRRVLYIIGTMLCVHVLLLLGLFSYQLDAWASTWSIPLPVFPIISALVVLRGKIPSR